MSWTKIAAAWDLVGGDGQLDNPLWSLRWELHFSLALPVFVLLAVILQRWWVPALIAVVIMTFVGIRAGWGRRRILPGVLRRRSDRRESASGA